MNEIFRFHHEDGEHTHPHEHVLVRMRMLAVLVMETEDLIHGGSLLYNCSFSYYTAPRRHCQMGFRREAPAGRR